MDNKREANRRVSAHNEFGTLQEEALKELIHESKDKHWKKILRESTNKVIQGKKEWFENKRKGYFYLMSQCPQEGMVLDVGAGSGIISDVVSNYFREVVALEYNPNFIDFMKLRFSQDERYNINLLRANALSLPFKANVFDLVIVNGVLEWVPNFQPTGNPRETQGVFLEDCLRKLKPRGKIIIGIENRFHFNYLLGNTPHGDYPFTTVLPRALANIISRIARKKPYLNYIYSSLGYKRILKKAGFKNIEIFVIVPTYYNPMIILPLNNNSIINKVIMSSDSLPKNKMRKILYLFLLKIGILKHLMHSFYITGEKI